MTTTDSDWLDTLKIGDQVAYDIGNSEPRYVIAKVVKLTKAKITLSSNQVFGRRDGWSIDTTRPYQLQPITPDVKALLIRQRIVARLNRVSWEKVSNAALIKIDQVLNMDEEVTA